MNYVLCVSKEVFIWVNLCSKGIRKFVFKRNQTDALWQSYCTTKTKEEVVCGVVVSPLY